MVLDVFSRRVVGWALGRTLEAELAVTALRMALAERRPSGCGASLRSRSAVRLPAYAALLAEHGIRGSMSRPGNPYDNARCGTAS